MSDSKFESLVSALLEQRKFSDLFYDSKNMSESEREESLRRLALCAHTAVSDIVSSVNFKSHLKTHQHVDHAKMLYKTVDLFRYTLAVLNLWDIDPQKFVDACDIKNDFLHMRHRLDSAPWDGRPVVVFDCDDVIAKFRSHFDNFLEKKWSIPLDPDSNEYYNNAGLVAAGLNPEIAFRDFLSSGQMRELKVNTNVADAMRILSDRGYWIQILTARPAESLNCFYDTFHWIEKNGIPCNAVGFSSEKYRWVSEQQFYMDGKMVCAVDDSPKHAAEFAAHGVKAIMPAMPYNAHVKNSDTLKRVDFSLLSADDIVKLVVDL